MTGRADWGELQTTVKADGERPFKAVLMIRNEKGVIASHLLEYSTRAGCETAIKQIEHWAGYYEIVRLYE